MAEHPTTDSRDDDPDGAGRGGSGRDDGGPGDRGPGEGGGGAQESSVRRVANPLARLLLVTSSLWFLGEGMLGPLFAVFSEEIGGDVLEIAALWAAFLVTSGICTATIGAWADRRGRHEIFSLVGYIGNALVTFGYLLVEAPWQLAVVQVLLGVCSALATPTWYVLFVRSISHQPKRQGFWLGLSSGQEEVATGVAALIGGLIVSAWGFRPLFVAMGVVQLVAASLQAYALHRMKQARPDAIDQVALEAVAAVEDPGRLDT